jgi:hypothetical protein
MMIVTNHDPGKIKLGMSDPWHPAASMARLRAPGIEAATRQ